MTIKQLGGVFGRNPTFNDVTIEGQLTFDGDIDINSDLKVNGDLEVLGIVGIGISPAQPLHVYHATTNGVANFQSGDANVNISLMDNTTTAANYVGIGAVGNNLLLISGNGGEKARVDSSGNLLISTTNTNPHASSTESGIALRAAGYGSFSASGTAAGFFNRRTSDGTILDFRQAGAPVGIIGTSAGHLYVGAGGDTNLLFNDTADSIYPWDSVANDVQDATVDLGASTARFKDLYRSGSTISTSDRNMKQDERDLTEAETRVAQSCKGLLKAFRFIDAVEVDGDNARIHFGIIAQDLQAAFEAEGLDATKYAMFRPSTFTDDEGNEQTRLGVCYENLLAFIIAAI